jgi:single-stranded-DNA-specific exonuclease
MKFTYLRPEGKSARQYLEAVAKTRGCSTLAEIEEFLDPLPTVRNNIRILPDYDKASERLRTALAQHERVVLFGDWDCDGIVSLVQMYDLIKAAGHEELEWFIPDRRSDDYGLTLDAAQRCYELFRPQLVISVDCGSPSHESALWLRNHGADTIVIDHHQLGAHKDRHPAVAHLNPKAFFSDTPEALELREMSASGLVYLFCEQFASDSSIDSWDKTRALLLAGVGTVVDVMRLVGVNRALAKHAMQLASHPETLTRVPGLFSLNQAAGGGAITHSTFGFVWGPRLNASGRLEEATAAVRLLMSETTAEALQWAEQCHTSNEERRRIQSVIVDAALVQASNHIANSTEEASRVLVLFQQDWHPGVVGIVASRVKERFSRPVIVLGWHDDGFCKGSGRSIPAYDIGSAIHAAASAGVILGGGGHHMAGGLKAELNQVDALREWLNANCSLTKEQCAAEVEILGRTDSLTPEEWCNVFDALEPAGNGNPRPSLYCPKSQLVWGPTELSTREGRVWALKAGFRTGSGSTIYCTWDDVESARSEWQRGSSYNLALNLARTRKGIETYYNWRVVMSEAT